jgi:hypothetical protein
MMNEAYEIELLGIKASFMASPFDLVIGAERKLLGEVEEWQVMYARILIDDRWHFMPHELYTEIDTTYGDMIGDRLFELSMQ